MNIPAIPSAAPARSARRRNGATPSEEQIQAAFMWHLQMRARPDVVAFHIPNGGNRSRAEAGRFKAAGVVAGVPDIIIFASGRTYAIEIKAAHGRLSDAQRAVHARLVAAGVEVEVVWGIDDALALLEKWNLLR